MKLRMVIVRANGKLTAHELTDRPTLEELQDLVGGHIERVRHFDRLEGRPCVAFCHEEGELLGLPFNRIATVLWRLYLGISIKHMPDALVGNVVIIQGDEELLRDYEELASTSSR
jgi:hypothetical protein